jgi:hypothetical protein
MFEGLGLNAFAWGALSAFSLPLGALLGIWLKPKQAINSAFMAFGAGALLFALTIELFGHVPHHAENHGITALFVAIISAVLGGLLFDGLNTILNGHGAFLRKSSQAKRFVRVAKIKRSKQLFTEFKKIAILKDISDTHLLELVISAQPKK